MPRVSVIIKVFVCLLLFPLGSFAAPLSYYDGGNHEPDTRVTLQGRDFLINGVKTYTGANSEAEGRLCTLRYVNATIDDLDGTYNPNWDDDGAPKPENDGSLFGPWNTREHAIRSMDALAVWRQYGVLGFVLNFQGGCQCDLGIAGGWQTNEIINSPYGADGNGGIHEFYQGISTPQSEYFRRMGSIIHRADDLGLVVILQLFYFGQDQLLQDDQAVETAAFNAIGWIIRNKFTNVILEPVNEANFNGYERSSLKAQNVHLLLEKIRNWSDKNHPDAHPAFNDVPANFEFPMGRLITTQSGTGGVTPGDFPNWTAVTDGASLHLNGVGPNQASQMVIDARNEHPGFVIVTESPNNFGNAEAVWEEGSCDGLYDDDNIQSIYPPLPIPWGTLQQHPGGWANLILSQTGGPGDPSTNTYGDPRLDAPNGPIHLVNLPTDGNGMIELRVRGSELTQGGTTATLFIAPRGYQPFSYQQFEIEADDSLLIRLPRRVLNFTSLEMDVYLQYVGFGQPYTTNTVTLELVGPSGP